MKTIDETLSKWATSEIKKATVACFIGRDNIIEFARVYAAENGSDLFVIDQTRDSRQK